MKEDEIKKVIEESVLREYMTAKDLEPIKKSDVKKALRELIRQLNTKELKQAFARADDLTAAEVVRGGTAILFGKAEDALEDSRNKFKEVLSQL